MTASLTALMAGQVSPVNKTGDTLAGALNGAPAVSLASAATVNIGAANSNRVNITGTVTITAFDAVAAGAIRTVMFTAALVLTHNAVSLILQTGSNIATEAGDVADFESLGSGNWRCTGYRRASGVGLAYNQNPTLSSINGGPLAGFHNLFCNGDFTVWQRGTSTAGATGVNFTGFAADRWQLVRSGFVTGSTYSKQVSGDLGSQSCARIQRDAGNTSTNPIYFGQTAETINSIPFQGKTVTFSFRARAGANFSSGSQALTVLINTGTGVDQNPIIGSFTGQVVQNVSVNLTPTWATYSLTVTLSSSITQIAGHVYYTPTGTAGAADYFEIGRMQFEVGSVVTPLDPRPYSVELALCRRYYQFYGGTAYSPYYLGVGINSTQMSFVQTLQVAMRVTPSLTIEGTVGNYPNPVMDQGNKSTVLLTLTTTGLTANASYRYLGSVDGTTKFTFSAEL